MYQIVTQNERTYKGITTWENWSYDNTFIHFKQNGKSLILPNRDITEISEE